MRSITCTNNNGYTITFDNQSFSPFILAHVDGIYGFENNLSISTNTMTDGGVFQGNVSKPRNITLTILDKPEYSNDNAQRSRDILYLLFSKDTLGTLIYTENGNSREINYRVEKMTVGNAKKRLYFIYLKAEDPYFYAVEQKSSDIATTISAFEFRHEFYQYEELSFRSQERLARIVNDNAVGGIGLEITIVSADDATNPSIIHVENNQHIKVGSSAKPFHMIVGDTLKITTGTNDKHVYLIRDGVRTEVNQYLTEDSEFIQLNVGVNNIGYEADSGEYNLRVRVAYRLKYGGA